MTKINVPDEVLATFTKRTNELYRRLTEGTLSSAQVLGGLQALVEGGLVGSHVVDLDADPFIPEGLKLVSHKKGGQLDLSTTKIVPLYTASQLAGKTIKGTKWMEELRTEKVVTVNANLCDYYHAHQEAIPKEFEKDGIIFFPDTVYSGDDGRQYVRLLFLDGGVWRRLCNWLGDGWCSIRPSASVAVLPYTDRYFAL